MANRKRDAGREALEKKGWWRSHRWLVLRRLCQFFVLGMFLSGPWFGVWILHGNYSSSLLFDTVPLTDPLMTLQSLASGHLPATVALTGAVIITVLYALAGKRLFCSWVCPLNPITDLANWLRRRFDLNQSATIPRHIRYVLDPSPHSLRAVGGHSGGIGLNRHAHLGMDQPRFPDGAQPGNGLR